MYHLIAKDKIAEQHISGKAVTAIVLELEWIYLPVRIQSSYYSAIQCAIGLNLYYLIAYEKLDE